MKTSDQLEKFTISLNNYPNSGMDFKSLVKEGVAVIEKLSGSNYKWTNYNPPDPGITLLEHICYAITDLNYRLSFPTADLLAEEPFTSTRETANLLFTAGKILSTGPVTENDYLRLLLDIKGVRGAWISELVEEYGLKSIGKGVHQVQVQYEHLLHGSSRSEITEVLHRCRNLCEDFELIGTHPQKLLIEAKIETEESTNLRELYTELYNDLYQFFSPKIKFYSLEELSTKGMAVEEIFSGPCLTHGFIREEDLKAFEKKRVIYKADVIELIYKHPKVKLIKSIHGINRPLSEPITTPIVLENLTIDFGILTLDKSALIPKKEKNEGAIPQDLSIPAGTYRNLKEFTLIQKDLPKNYGFGKTSSVDPHTKQLQAYLFFFNQILANYFAQLDGAKKLYNAELSNITLPGGEEITTTYFTQDIAREFLSDNIENIYSLFNKVSDCDRQNRLLDHLLAIFGEKFTDYSNAVGRPRTQLDLITVKIKWLQDYHEISSNRCKGINYKEYDKENEDYTVLHRRIADLLNIEPQDFYIVEHILLRYCAEAEEGYDPYSYRISFIFKNTLFNKDKRLLVQEIIEREIPAHLNVNVRWLPQVGGKKIDFINWKKIYQRWRNLLAKQNLDSDAVIQQAKKIQNYCFTGIGYMVIEGDEEEGELPFIVL